MIAADFSTIRERIAQPTGAAEISRQIGIEEYYSEAGPDYAAWSPEFNMHFGCYRAGSSARAETGRSALYPFRSPLE